MQEAWEEDCNQRPALAKTSEKESKAKRDGGMAQVVLALLVKSLEFNPKYHPPPQR
jgi:hypothetical protein